MKLFSLLLLALGLLLAGGCSKYKVVRVDQHNPNQEGIRYYRPAPYLLVTGEMRTTNAAGATTTIAPGAEIIYLPDPTECYAIQYQGGLGATKTIIKLVNGWRLDEFNNDTDPKVNETIKATGDLLTAIVGAAKKSTFNGKLTTGTPDTTLVGLPPGLYKLNLQANPPKLVRVTL